jgi:hypothetical protein
MFDPGARLDAELEATAEEVEAAFNELAIETKSRVLLVLNFYEELSCSYREGLLDEEVAKKMLLPAIEAGWERAEPFIRQQRAKTQELLDEREPGEPTEVVKPEELMEEWEELVKDLRARTESPKTWSEKIDPTMWFDGLVIRGVGLIAAALIILVLIVVGVTAVIGHGSGDPSPVPASHVHGGPLAPPEPNGPGREFR